MFFSAAVRLISLTSFLFLQSRATETRIEGALTGYTSEAVDLVEFLYGDGILSLGATEAIDDMFADIQLDHQYVLDIGCGTGGVDTYLAQKYTVTILGVDPEKMLVERATQRALKLHKNFKGSVTFEQLLDQTNLKQYPDNTFDMVISREAILHVPCTEKTLYFIEMLRVLKPGGLLIIDDWMHPSATYTASVKEMMEIDGIPYNLITPSEYEDFLKTAGFINIVIRDTTERAYTASADICKRAQNCKDEMIKRFGEEMYHFSLKSWSLQTEIFKRKELLTGIIAAQKQSDKKQL